jgi:hypothetical protein
MMKIVLLTAGLLFAPTFALAQTESTSGNSMQKPCKKVFIEGNTEDIVNQGV